MGRLTIRRLRKNYWRFPEVHIGFTGARMKRKPRKSGRGNCSDRCVCLAGKNHTAPVDVLYTLAEILVTTTAARRISRRSRRSTSSPFRPETPALFSARTPRNTAIWRDFLVVVRDAYNSASRPPKYVCMQEISVEQVLRSCRVTRSELARSRSVYSALKSRLSG